MIKWLAGLFLIFIFVVVASADTGIGDHVYSFVFTVPIGDKIGHFFLMGTLSLLVNLAMGVRTARFGRYDILLGSLLVAIGVTLEELSQIWIASRSFSLLTLRTPRLVDSEIIVIVVGVIGPRVGGCGAMQSVHKK